MTDAPDMGMYENMIKDLKKQILGLRRKIDEKMDLQEFQMSMQRYISREDVLSMIGNMQQGGDKIAKVLRDIATLFKDLKGHKKSTEARFARILKELDIQRRKRDQRDKAQAQQIKQQFEAYDVRLLALADLLESLKNELNGTKKLKKTVNAIIAIMTKDQANALATTSNVPQLCLSCGRGNAKFIPPVHYVSIMI